MKKFATLFIIFVVISILTFSLSVSAYNNSNNHSCLWDDPQDINYKFLPDIPTEYRYKLAEAVVGWNNATNVSLYFNSSSFNTFSTYEEDSTTMGTTSYTCTFFHLGDTINTSDVGLNETYFNNSSLTTTNKDKLKLKVSLHEMGHFIGLGHSTVTPAVMQSGVYYSSSYLAPTTDDINGYNALY